MNVRARLIGLVAGAACGTLSAVLSMDWLQPPRPVTIALFFAVAGGIIGVIVAMNVELAREDRARRDARER